MSTSRVSRASPPIMSMPMLSLSCSTSSVIAHLDLRAGAADEDPVGVLEVADLEADDAHEAAPARDFNRGRAAGEAAPVEDRTGPRSRLGRPETGNRVATVREHEPLAVDARGNTHDVAGAGGFEGALEGREAPAASC